MGGRRRDHSAEQGPDRRPNGAGALLFFAPRNGNPKRTLQDAGMPRMLAADFSHNRLFVADQGARHIAVLAYPNGKQLGTFSGGLRSVYGVAFDAKP